MTTSEALKVLLADMAEGKASSQGKKREPDYDLSHNLFRARISKRKIGAAGGRFVAMKLRERGYMIDKNYQI